jgi:hypothetical protein
MSLVDSIPGASARARSTSRQVFAVWGLVLACSAGWSYSKGWVAGAAAAALPGLLLLLSAIRPPRFLSGFAGKAATFSDHAADLLSRIVLGLWYYLIFTPVAALWRVFRGSQPDREGRWRDFAGQERQSFQRPF